jgi:hypothetical protein
MLSLLGIVAAGLAFCYLAFDESTVWPRASAGPSAQTPEFVHERFQRSYFSLEDAAHLRLLHYEQGAALLVFAFSWATFAYSRRTRTDAKNA